MDASSDTKELKRKYWDLIRKSDEVDEVPNLTGHEVARWVRNGQHTEFEDKNDLLSSDKIPKMIGLVDKRQNYVNFTVKDSYKDGKNYINLVSFEWL